MNILSFIIVLLVVLPVWGDWFSTQSPDTCTGPRIRKAWSSLLDTEKQNYLNLILTMKNTIITVRSDGTKESLYNVFPQIHTNSMNSNVWHATSHFLVVHRWFVYQFESALRYICRVNGSSLNPPITDCCSIGLPYWNSEVDYENCTTDSYVPQDHSAVFDTNYLGPAPCPANLSATNYTVNGVAINPTTWPTYTALNNNPSPSKFLSNPGLANYLRRWMNSTTNPFTVGPIWIINKMNSTCNYAVYDGAVEAGPHSGPHIWLGFHMTSMSSPDDPLFMLHHSNMDRLFALWQDCWDYELVWPTDITIKHYQPLNPISGSQAKINVCTNSSYDVGTDTPMIYWWKSFSSTSANGTKSNTNQDCLIFPQAEWPRPRDMHFIGNETQRGWGGMYYVYGPDNLVSLMQQLTTTTCPLNTQWRLVNVDNSIAPSSKRDISDKVKDKDEKNKTKGWNRSANDQNSENNIKSKWNEVKLGKSDEDAWKLLVAWECLNTPKIELTEQFEAWISMTGLDPALWDREGCDYVSDKWKKKHGDKLRVIDIGLGNDNGVLSQHQRTGQHHHVGQHHGDQHHHVSQHQHGAQTAHVGHQYRKKP